jgi:hypothetical protein
MTVGYLNLVVTKRERKKTKINFKACRKEEMKIKELYKKRTSS